MALRAVFAAILCPVHGAVDLGVVLVQKRVVLQTTVEGTAKPYEECEADINSGSADADLTCLATTDDDDLTCTEGLCYGTALKGEKCRDSTFTGKTHKAKYVCKPTMTCDGYVDGTKWGECVGSTPAPTPAPTPVVGTAKPYEDCEADVNSGSSSAELTCLATTDEDDLTCAGYVDGESEGTCYGTASKGNKCRDSTFTGKTHQAQYVCESTLVCIGYTDGEKWGECSDPPTPAPTPAPTPVVGTAKPYYECEADVNSGSSTADLTCLATVDDDDLTCKGFVEGDSEGKCYGTASKGDKCRDKTFSGSTHKAKYVCKSSKLKCKGYSDGEKWGECVKK